MAATDPEDFFLEKFRVSLHSSVLHHADIPFMSTLGHILNSRKPKIDFSGTLKEAYLVLIFYLQLHFETY